MYEDYPMRNVGDVFESLLYGKNPLGREIIGYKKSIKSFGRKDLVKYMQRFYLANETVICIAGNISEKKIVKTSSATYEAKAIIFSTGSHYKEIGVRGEKEFRGRGVSYCGVCDGPFFKGKKVLVIGGGNSACITTLYLSGIAAQVTVIHRREAFRAEKSLVTDIAAKGNVTTLWNTEIQEIKGDKQVKTVTIINNITKQTSELAVDAVFVQVGEAPNSQIAKDSGVETDEHGYIKINIRQQTNMPGIFAAGDVTNHPIKQVGTAVGQGITAALEAYSYIRRPYYRK
jgi:thioredoxin reductase (NADPH)